ncbi:CHAT domain-containing protein [Thelonectria olida]|uniref:CHAT domain-containing protein n=1 Tax=Thelonectria olida TaxID=1576542 RepID=A0A9P9AIV4_9HYPO|nr:CHAT domain-containing protein [Thelonectria olida]
MENSLELGLESFQRSLNTTPANHPDRVRLLQGLGSEYLYRFQISEAIDDLEIGIGRLQEALDEAYEHDADRAVILHDLGTGHRYRFEKNGEIADIEVSVNRSREALDLLAADHPHKSSFLEGLGIGLMARYQRLGATEDTETAVRCLREALELESQDALARAEKLTTLGLAYRIKYGRTAAPQDFEMATAYFQEALEKTPEHHPGRPKRLQALGNIYKDKYLRTGAMSDIKTAITLFKKILDIISHDHPGRVQYLSDLGGAYGDTHRTTGRIEELDVSIDLLQEAVNQSSSNHSCRVQQLYSLGSAHQYRYRATGSMRDLRVCIEILDEAIKLVTENHPYRVPILQNLGAAYMDNHQRTGKVDAIEKAISKFEEALAITSMDHPDRARRLHNLGTGYFVSYQSTKLQTDFEKSVALLEDALGRLPEGHADRPRLLQDIGIQYSERYQDSKVEEDLEISLGRLQEALNVIPEEHPDRATLLRSPVGQRLEAGKASLEFHAFEENWTLAYEIAVKTVSMIPLVASRSLDQSDKQYLATRDVGLTSDAAAVALMAGKDTYEAIRLLELGRGLILGSLNDMRADVLDLQQRYPTLGQEYIQFRDQLDTPASMSQHSDSASWTNHESNQRYDAGKGLERTIQTIRSKPGFERFLMAPTADEIKEAASSGPLVVINASKHRCDALIINETSFRTLNLPRLHSIDIANRVTQLKPQTITMELLEWMWDSIAQPVLEYLGFLKSPQSSWPHICWIPTGPLARFPIHAAGYHLNSSDNVMDQAISSYSPSVRAIVESRQRLSRPRTRGSPNKMVLVGMDDLFYAPQEVEQLALICDGMQISRPRPYQEDVMRALQDCDIFHFAGHGRTEPLDPSRSALVLKDEPLTVQALFETNLRSRHPFLAYLSACGTGQVENAELIDEGLHLIAACQLAGFQHVIGTLWDVDDRSCVDVATITYDWMKKQGLSGEGVAEGLFHACRSLRTQWISENASRAASNLEKDKSEEKGSGGLAGQGPTQGGTVPYRNATVVEDIPLLWVPYVHFGS